MHKWQINIKMDLKGIGEEGMDWINLEQYMDKWWALRTRK